MSQTLCTAAVPSNVRVRAIDGPYAVRLMEMGITPGQTLQVIRRAPTGFPVEIQIRGYLISLRKEEAEGVHLED